MLQPLDRLDEQVARHAHDEADPRRDDEEPPLAAESKAGREAEYEIPESGGLAASVSWQGRNPVRIRDRTRFRAGVKPCLRESGRGLAYRGLDRVSSSDWRDFRQESFQRSTPMIEALKSDEIVRKVGGRFRLTALIQKRIAELIDGARPLVERNGMSDLEVVIEEIMQDKISLEDPTQPEG
ncbi:MAG: DNA-directed RNA polymerase subunit omega [Phycisphaerales bacterium]|nr:DNA-directed RNA polymerase subunit omega [Phycisphaerales bacterium]